MPKAIGQRLTVGSRLGHDAADLLSLGVTQVEISGDEAQVAQPAPAPPGTGARPGTATATTWPLREHARPSREDSQKSE